jgi:hypothetical protein
MSAGDQSSFVDIAVALSLAASKLRLDLMQTEVIAERIGLSKMGLGVALEGLRADVARVEEAQDLLKRMADIEPQVRALIARKESRRWFPSFVRTAAL